MFFNSKKVLGVDIGTSSVKVAEIEVSRKGLSLNKFSVFPLNPGAVSNGEVIDAHAVTNALSQAIKASKSKRKTAATAMWGNTVIVKKITRPRIDNPATLDEEIQYEASHYIPFPIEEVSLEYHILKTAKNAAESMEILLVAAKREFIFRYIEAIEGSGLKCKLMDVSGFALANSFEANYGVTDTPVAVLNIGAGITNFIVVERGEVIFSRDIPVGGLLYTMDINKMMGVSMTEAEALKISACMGQEAPDEVNRIIQSTNDAVIDEIRNGFEFFSATSGGSSISKFYVSGGGMFVPGLIDSISKAVGIPYEVFDPLAKVTIHKSITPEYANQIRPLCGVVLGLGMRQEGDS